MRFSDQASAKHFFIKKIIQQAQSEGIELSEAEVYMLEWSESDQTFIQNSKLNTQFEQETTDGKYEHKISGLIKNAFKRDVAFSQNTKEEYLEAYSVLSKGDYYLLIMIDSAIALKRKGWFGLPISNGQFIKTLKNVFRTQKGK